MQGPAPCVVMGTNGAHFEGHEWPSYQFHVPQCLQLSAWGPNNLMAYVVPSSHDVWVVDGESLQVVQTLSGHTSPISSLIWVPTKDSQFQQNSVQLLVGDSGGHISLWDVLEGAITRRIQLPHNHAVANLQLIASSHLLLVLTGDSTSYVYDAQLNQSTPMKGMVVPTTRNTCPNDGALLVSVSRSSLAADGAFAVAWSDKIRLIRRVEGHSMSNMLDKGDPISMDIAVAGVDVVVDVCFSCSTQEVIYVASPSRVIMYDWKLNMVLNERFIVAPGAEFKRIFPSWQFDCPYDCGFEDEDAAPLTPQEFPVIYTLTMDWKLTAWFPTGCAKYEAGLLDGRAGHNSSKSCYSVTQHASNPMCFLVSFVDGGLSQWRFSPRQRRWICEGYLEGSLVKPVCMCPLNDGIRVAVALQSGAVVIQNILYGTVERRCTVVKAASTHIRSMHTTPSPDEISIVTERTAGSESVLQVCLFNVDSFSVLQLVREGDDRSLGSLSTTSKLKSSCTDDSSMYLLLEFEFGAFEVWNLQLRKLIHLSRGVGAAGFSRVFWGVATRNLSSVSTMYKSQTSLSKSPQQMVGVAHDTTLVYYVPLRDKLVLIGEKFHMPWKAQHSNIPSHQVHMAGYGDKLVSVEGGKGVYVARGMSSPKVGELATMPHQTQASHVAFYPYGVNGTDEGDLVAIVFKDGSFGVWNAHTRRQVGYSWSSELHIKAVHVSWLRGKRLLLLTDVGTMAVTTAECTSVNSPFADRRLQSPLQSPAFLLPTHSAHLKTHCEMQTIAALASIPLAPPSSSSQATLQARGAAYECKVPVEQALFWTNCFGQRLNAPLSTLEEELSLHTSNILPCWLQDHLSHLREACASSDCAGQSARRAARILQWIAWYFGHSTRASFWWAVFEFVSKESGTSTPPTPTPTYAHVPDDPLSSFPSTRLEHYIAQYDLFQEIAYPYPSPISESCAHAQDLKHNQARLVLFRLHALQLQQCLPVDDSIARLSVARDLLRLDELGRASEVLLESNFSSTNFAAHSQLALNIAASQDRRLSSRFDGSMSDRSTTQSNAFQLTSKRAAAMLLARGDVDGAVEMFVLIQEHYEACLTLQSCGRWVDAAVLAQLAPNVTEDRLQEILTRWARHNAQRGFIIPSVLLLLKVGALSVVASLLSDSSQYSDVAGVFILYLAAGGLLSTQDLEQSVSSPLRTDRIFKPKTEPPTFVQSGDNDLIPSLKEVVKAIRVEYQELLESTMNSNHISLLGALLDPAS